MPNNMRDTVVYDTIHIFFLLDTSGSMFGASITALNTAVSNALTALEESGKNKEVDVMVHIVSFDSIVTWRCGTTAENGVLAGNVQWTDLVANGGTDTAGAINAILPGLSTQYLGKKTFRPIIILISDGESNNHQETLDAIAKLNKRQKTINVAIGVKGYNVAEMEAFASERMVALADDMGNETEPVLRKLVFSVGDIKHLAELIKAAAVSSLIASVLQGQETQDETGETNNVNPEEEPPVVLPADAGFSF